MQSSARLATVRSTLWRIPARSFGEELQDDESAKLGILSFIDHAHASAAQFFEDAVVRDRLADHGPKS